MALQDQTLANTQAKMGLEAAARRRQRGTEAALAAVGPSGPRQPGDLPWWAQTRADGGTPVSNATASRVRLRGLGGLVLGVAGQKVAKQIQQRTDPIYADRKVRTPAQLERAPTAASFSRREGPAGMSPAQMASIRVSLQTVLEIEGIPGVERLVRQGRFPVATLELLKNVPSGGRNGAPAGEGLPELGVL